MKRSTFKNRFHPIGRTAGRSPVQLPSIPQRLPRICTVTGYISAPGSRRIQDLHRPCCATLTPCQLRVVRRVNGGSVRLPSDDGHRRLRAVGTAGRALARIGRGVRVVDPAGPTARGGADLDRRLRRLRSSPGHRQTRGSAAAQRRSGHDHPLHRHQRDRHPLHPDRHHRGRAPPSGLGGTGRRPVRRGPGHRRGAQVAELVRPGRGDPGQRRAPQRRRCRCRRDPPPVAGDHRTGRRGAGSGRGHRALGVRRADGPRRSASRQPWLPLWRERRLPRTGGRRAGSRSRSAVGRTGSACRVPPRRDRHRRPAGRAAPPA